jgi:hypothetical protein
MSDDFDIIRLGPAIRLLVRVQNDEQCFQSRKAAVSLKWLYRFETLRLDGQWIGATWGDVALAARAQGHLHRLYETLRQIRRSMRDGRRPWPCIKPQSKSWQRKRRNKYEKRLLVFQLLPRSYTDDEVQNASAIAADFTGKEHYWSQGSRESMVFREAREDWFRP